MASEEVDADVISCGCTPLIVTWPKLSLTVVFPMGGEGGGGRARVCGKARRRKVTE